MRAVRVYADLSNWCCYAASMESGPLPIKSNSQKMEVKPSYASISDRAKIA